MKRLFVICLASISLLACSTGASVGSGSGSGVSVGLGAGVFGYSD